MPAAGKSCEVSESKSQAHRRLTVDAEEINQYTSMRETISGTNHDVIILQHNAQLDAVKISHYDQSFIVNVEEHRPKSLLLKTATHKVVINFDDRGQIASLGELQGDRLAVFEKDSKGQFIKR